MSFGGGSGSSSISASTDVVLNNPANNNVLGYNSGSAKWQNQDLSSAYLAQSSGVLAIVRVSQDEFNALTPVPGTLYVVVEASGVTLQMPLTYVRFTTTGATFNPTVELVGGSTATVSWEIEGGATVTGISPTLNYGSAATRYVRMAVTDTGISALNQVLTVNLGFNSGDDAGTYNMGSGYNKPTQSVTRVESLRLLKGLRRFAAANGPLAGTLDFTDCASLEFIECYGADVQAVTLTGCTALIRLCMENCNLAQLDLNPVAANLKDLRAAVQQSGTLTFATLMYPLASLYHLCIRDQIVLGHPAATQMPVLEERWDWNTGQSGALVSASSAIRSLLPFGNAYTTADLTGQFPAGRSGTLDAHGNALTSVVLAGCYGLVTINLADNRLATAAVDAVLAEVDSWATSGGTLNLAGNAPSSASGAPHTAALRGRGWTVTVVTTIFSDDFARADVTGIANIGNGWHGSGGAGADLVSGDLVRTDAAGYQYVLNPAGGLLPADYTVTASIPSGSTFGSWFGLIGRWSGGNGVRLLFTYNANTITVGDASGYADNNVSLTTYSFPASWSNTGIDHTIAMKMTGTTIEIYCDGTLVATGTVTTNSGLTGTEYGIDGEGQNRHWHSIGTTT